VRLADYTGLPYQPPRGCMMLARAFLAELGIPVPDVDNPGDAFEWKRVDRPQPNDLVVFNKFGRPNHVGVCLGRDRFLHSAEGQLSGIERLSSPLWHARIEGYYRWSP
jgi:cell wall-associated NlpC family hydrolase